MHLGLQQWTKLNLFFRNTINGYTHCLVSNNEEITLLDCTTCFPRYRWTLYEFQFIYNLNVFSFNVPACKMTLHLHA